MESKCVEPHPDSHRFTIPVEWDYKQQLNPLPYVSAHEWNPNKLKNPAATSISGVDSRDTGEVSEIAMVAEPTVPTSISSQPASGDINVTKDKPQETNKEP